MPISITCPGCGKRLTAKDSLAGRTAPCPGCGQKLVIGSADDIAAAILMGGPAVPSAKSKPAVPPSPSAPEAPVRQEPEGQERAPRGTGARPSAPASSPAVRKVPVEATAVPAASPRSPAAKAPDVRSLAPLTTNDPPLWLRHLHWLLVLSLVPLAVSLLQKPEKELAERFNETLEQAPEESQRRAIAVIKDLEAGKGSLSALFAALPDHKLEGALLPHDTWAHWLFTAGATALFFTFLVVLASEGSARPTHLLGVGLFTATLGILFLLAVQAMAMWSQGVMVIPRSIVGLLFWVVKLIGFSYRAALDPDNGFLLSFVGYTFGVGLCEEICKALPLIVKYHEPDHRSWRGAYLWGLASGAGFGVAEGVIYASDFYNGISGPGAYLVRNISCVALHALWTGSAAITIHQRQHLFQDDEMNWYDWLLRAVAVVAVPMVLHGLYDTLLKKELNALALAVAIASFFYLAFQISRLRGADDQTRHNDMLREYQRRRVGWQT